VGSATFGVDLSAERDLKDYGDTTSIGALTRERGRRLLGMDVGFERQRTLNTRFSYQPPFTSWLRPRYSVSTNFSINRDPNARIPEREIGDSAGAFRLPTAFANGRSVELGGSLDFSRALRGLTSDSTVLRVIDRLSQLDVSRRIERRSQFSRPGFDPGLSYQLGLGGRDAFRRQAGRLSTSASEVVSDRLGSSLRLPLNFTITGTYNTRRQLTWSLRGQSQQEIRSNETEWPNLDGRWTWTPSGALAKVVTSMNAGVGLRERRNETVQPSLGAEEGAQQASELRTLQETRSTPLRFSLTWAPRIVTDFAVTRDDSRSDRSGNLTFNRSRSFSAGVNFSFRPPRELLPLPSDVRARLRYGASRNTGCIRRAGAEECTPISDSRRREYQLNMDTELPPNVSAGLALSYVLTEDAHANRKFSQLQLLAHVLVSFTAGDLR
jgi:hypothetical protein